MIIIKALNLSLSYDIHLSIQNQMVKLSHIHTTELVVVILHLNKRSHAVTDFGKSERIHVDRSSVNYSNRCHNTIK